MRRLQSPFLKMRHRRRRSYQNVPEAYRTQIALWILRILLITQTEEIDFLPHEDWFIKIVGKEIYDNKKVKDFDVTSALEEKLKKLEKNPIRKEGSLYTNIDHLANMIGLTAIDKEVLAFIVLFHTHPCLGDCVELFEALTPATANDVLSQVLGLDKADLRTVLKEDGTLYASGIVRVDWTDRDLVRMLSLLDGMGTALLREEADSKTMFQAYFTPLQQSSLTPEDFPHLQEDFLLLRGILKNAIEQGVKGVNILIYGETGTGKTEFAKVLAASLNVSPLTISHENESSDLEEKLVRFRSYLLAQKVLAQQRQSVILFDEVEDVFPMYRSRERGNFKAWTNAVLESNPCPAFWLCNEIYQIDPAFRRRFTYTLHIKTPVRSVRRGILVKHLGNLSVSEEWIDKIAASEAKFSPAIIGQACKIASLTGGTDSASLERVMERALQNSLEVMGLPRELKSLHGSPVTPYSLDFLNPSQNLVAVTEGLKQRPAARLCFYGPPGSGKTAFAHYIAKEVDAPLLQKHASDILNCFVGVTEKNIAKMFREAKEEKAILLLDEADSFLQDRRGAHRSWEVTQVNELLVQMETFDGLFICSTNLMDSLDQAVLRRFDFKIKFGFLMPDQRWQMFLRSLEKLGCPIEDAIEDKGLIMTFQQRLEQLSNLTPGDFATVIRQARVLGKAYTCEAFLSELENECKVKTGAGTQVKGFVG